MARSVVAGTMERYITPEKLPTPFESEVLEILAEECAEVIQRVSKIKRFGLHEVQPGQPASNRERFSREMGQLIRMVDYARQYGLLDEKSFDAGFDEKPGQLYRYMQSDPPT